jgi:CubicO group peptidase (beta-lactamase class C family)|tara:strand:- start:24 stop:1466 length:1443 start_codon:yes stop_codon:yes gene_type:complete
MRIIVASHLALTMVLLITCTSQAEQVENFDYFTENRTTIRNGIQAVLTCNGLFTSDRSLKQIFDQELAYLAVPVGTIEGGEYLIDRERKAVAIGGPESGTIIRAAFRQGVGCVVMAPHQTFADIDDLPKLNLPYPDSDPASTPWPMGDVIEAKNRPKNIDWAALGAASDWAWHRETEEQDTISLIVVHKGQIILERYADGVDMMTRTRSYSAAKSIVSTLIGILVDDGRLKLDESLGIQWLPDVDGHDDDPRNAITLRNVLNMSSGLYPVDNFNMEYATGSGVAYWAGASSADNARDRALIRAPGTHWEYQNYDTLLAVFAMKQALADPKVYAEFPRMALFDRIGMRNTLASTDRFGDFILSSQVYTTARDLARLGLLYAQGGTWLGERLLSKDWIRFVRTPAPSAASRGSDYGGHFVLVPDDRTDVPKMAYMAAGNRGQYVVIVPSHDTVIVRRGLDYGKQGFDPWDLTREVLKAILPQ